MSRRLKNLLGKIGLWLGVAVLVLWSVGPVYWSFVASITPPNALASSRLHLWPEAATWQHYAKLFGATSISQGNEVASVWRQFSRTFANTLMTSLAATALVVIIAAFGAWAFVRLEFPGHNVLFVMVVAIPAYAVKIPLYRLMISLGLIDTCRGVTLFSVSAFLPLVFSPTLATKPLTVLIPEFVTRNYVDYGLMNAAGIVTIAPPLLLVMFLNRYLVSGLMAGAGK